MAKEAVKVISDEAMLAIKKVGADETIASEASHTFLKIIASFSFEKLNQEIAKFKAKEMSGILTDDDRGLFDKLLTVHKIRQSAIERNVADIFALAKEGNTRKAALFAAKLVKEESDGIPTSVLSSAEKKQIEVLAKDVVGVVADQSQGKLKYDGVDQTKIDSLLSANEVRERGDKIKKQIEQKIDVGVIKKESARVAEVIDDSGTKDVIDKIGMVTKSNKDEKAATSARSNKKFDATLVEAEAKHSFKNRIKESKAGRKSKKVIEDLLDNGSETTKTLREQVKAGGKGKKDLEEYVDSLVEVEKVLDSERVAAALRKDHGNGIDAKVVQLKIGDWELPIAFKKSASKKQRLEVVLKLVSGDKQPWSDDEKIDLISQALNIPLAEKARAEAIWNEAKDWEKKYGLFAEKVEELRYNIDEEIHPIKKVSPQDEEVAMIKHIERYGNLDGYRGLGTSAPGVDQGGIDDDDTKYNERGKEVLAQMDEFKLLIPDGKTTKGEIIYRAETNMEHWNRKKAEGRVPSGYGMNGRSMELAKIAGGKKYLELDETERPRVVAGVRDAIEDMIGRVMATGDSSRAPNNQPLAWEINELMSWLEAKEDADFRDLWQARLGTYDQSAVLASIGKKDGHEQVAGYVPREWLAVLFEDDIKFGNFRDANGKMQQYELSSKYVHAMLSEQVPGAKDRTDIWLGRIQGATSLEEVGLAKRRFMAYLMGQQRGVDFSFDSAGNFSIVNTPENIARSKSVFGEETFTIFREVGLGDDGNFLSNEEYKKLEKYDLFAKKWFFLNQSLVRHRIELTENELERGGNEKGWWAQTINAFRKLHGRSARDYTETKNMGMPSSRASMDSYWRSFPAWKLMSKDAQGEYFVIHKLLKHVPPEKREDFVVMFEHIAYMPERFEIGKLNRNEKHGYGGGLKATADVRHMTPEERSEIDKYFGEVNGSANFDWTEILKTMNVPAAKLTGNLKGTAGLSIFLENYNLNEFIDYGKLNQGFWVDFLSYTQAQGKFWDQMSQLVTNLANPKLQEAAIGIIRSYDDGLANAKSAEWVAKITNEMGMDINGYESLVGKDGVESSKKWKVSEGDSAEMALVQSLGYRRLPNGHVVDGNGHYMARPGNVPFLKDILDLNAKKSFGSPWIGRGFAGVSWEDKKDLVYKYLKNFSISDPKVWRDVHARFNAGMYFGVEFKGNEEPTMANVIKKLNKEPWKYATLPYTILRGLYVDAPIDLATIIAGWNPIGKQIGRIFEV